MSKKDILNILHKQLLIPVIRTNSFANANNLIKQLHNCGIKVVEITTSVPGFDKLIKIWSSKIIVGVGTILSKKDAKKAIKNGAKFLVSPVNIKEVSLLCEKENIVLASGALTPNEIHDVLKSGADIIKIFPAKSIGGASYLKTIIDVFGPIDLMPTGGIDMSNIKDYLDLGIKLIGIGSSLTDSSSLAEFNKKCKEFLAFVAKYRKDK